MRLYFVLGWQNLNFIAAFVSAYGFFGATDRFYFAAQRKRGRFPRAFFRERAFCFAAPDARLRKIIAGATVKKAREGVFISLFPVFPSPLAGRRIKGKRVGQLCPALFYVVFAFLESRVLTGNAFCPSAYFVLVGASGACSAAFPPFFLRKRTSAMTMETTVNTSVTMPPSDLHTTS